MNLPVVSHRMIQQLLLDQYQCTEEYCNATTALHNTFLEQQQSPAAFTTKDINIEATESSDTERAFQLRSSIDRYQQSLTNVQNNIRHMEQLVSSIVEQKQKQLRLNVSSTCNDKSENDNDSSFTFLQLMNLPILQDHLHRTYRILRTIYTMGEGTSYYNNGIMTPNPIVSQSQFTNQINIKLVALASLRASVQMVKESLPP